MLDFLGNYLPGLQYNRSMSYAVAGHNLSDEQKDKLESIVLKNPNDLRSRIILLGSYSPFKPHEKDKRLAHIEWVVKNHPEHAIAGSAYAQVHIDDLDYLSTAALWVDQTKKHKRNPRVLVNAANFYTLRDKDLAEEFFKKAIALDPNNDEIKHKLAHLYTLSKGYEQQALVQKEELCKRPDSEDLLCEMTDLPNAALAAGDIERAISASNKLLELSEKYRTNWHYGNAVNQAHTVLGRVALKNGDIEAAKKHLQLSSIDIATPQTQSFGPCLDLAKELAKTGEKSVVLEYLDEVERLCGVTNERAFELRYSIEHGVEKISLGPLEMETYVDEKIERQLIALQGMPEDKRRTHLGTLIKRTKDEIETWVRRVEESRDGENQELLHYASYTLEAQKKHLINLEKLDTETPQE